MKTNSQHMADRNFWRAAIGVLVRTTLMIVMLIVLWAVMLIVLWARISNVLSTSMFAVAFVALSFFSWLFCVTVFAFYPSSPAWCPRCGCKSLRALAAPFMCFFQCVNCKHRLKWLGLRQQWEDASGPENDKFFRWRMKGSVWIEYVPPRFDKSDKSTLGTLVRKKWARNGTGPIKPVPMAPLDVLHDRWLDD